MQILAVFGLLLATVFWGSTFILVKWSVAAVDVYYFLFLRFSLAFLLLAIPFCRKLWTTPWKTWKPSLLLGGLLTIVYISQTEGLRFTTASNSALITGLYVVFVPLFLKFFFKIKSNRSSVLGALCSLIGLYLLTKYSFTGINVGDMVTLICSVACAWHIIFIGKFTKHHDMIALTMLQFLVVAVVCGILTLVKGTYTTSLPQVVWFSVGITALFCSVIVFLIQTAAQRVIDPTRAGIIFVMEAVFGALFAWWWGGEMLSSPAKLGAGLMVSGMLISELVRGTKQIRTKAKQRRRAATNIRNA